MYSPYTSNVLVLYCLCVLLFFLCVYVFYEPSARNKTNYEVEDDDDN